MRDIHKTEKRIVLTLKFLVMDKRKNIQSVPKSTFKRFVDLSLMGKEGKRHFFLSKILIHFCMIIHYFLEENIFIAIFYKLLVPQKYLKIMLIAFVPENNGKKNPDEYYTSIYQKNIA